MGCCLSTEVNRATQKQSPKPHQQFPRISKSPPRSEEESVKEVLSETPKPRPRPNREPIPGIEISKHEDPKTEELEQPTKPNLILSPKKPPLPVIGLKYPDPSGHVRACIPKPRPIPGIEISMHEDPKTEDLEEPTKHVTWPKCPDPSGHVWARTTPEEISDVSEMCSQSDSISTTTLREREEDEDEVLQRVYRSQGQNSHFTTRKSRVAFSGGRTSPLRRSDPSPTRRRNMDSGQPMENPGRRSRSPATRSIVGRSPSGRRIGPSPVRVRNEPGLERESGVRKVEENINGGRRENEDEKERGGPNESLENPLFSLECFIFL